MGTLLEQKGLPPCELLNSVTAVVKYALQLQLAVRAGRVVQMTTQQTAVFLMLVFFSP